MNKTYQQNTEIIKHSVPYTDNQLVVMMRHKVEECWLSTLLYDQRHYKNQ